MRTRLLITTILFTTILSVGTAYGQTYETLKNVRIVNTIKLTKKVKAKDCDQPVKVGDVVKSETVFKNTSDSNETTKTIITEDKITTAGNIKVDKDISVKVTALNGKANIYVDDKDSSLIHVNYWLNPTNVVTANTKIKYRPMKYGCNGVAVRDDNQAKVNLATDKTFRLIKKTALGIEDYLTHCDTIIEVYKSDGTTLDYFLINKYDRKIDYTFQLANRETISLKNSAVVFGPLTIPIKYRFALKKNGVKVNEDFSADLNIGFFAGKTFGKQKVNYQRGVGFKDNVSLSSITVGAFLNIGTVTLNKANTTIGNVPITTDYTQSVGLISPGFGLIKSIYNFQFGIFYGWDLGVGRDSDNWNYDGKPWLGIGLGYSLTGFWKK